MNANIKNEIINGDFPEEFKDWISENSPILRYQSVEGAVKGFIRSRIPYENPEDWLFSINNTEVEGFLLKLEKTGLHKMSYIPADAASGYTIKAYYKGDEYYVYDVAICFFKP